MLKGTEADILHRVISPADAPMAPEVATLMLAFGFAEADHSRMTELAKKSNEGTLTSAERDELERCVNVGYLLSILQSKARLSLRNPPKPTRSNAA